MTPFIVIDHVTYSYDAAATDAPALDDLSLEIGEGEYLALVGANGSGKSTLARHLNALLLPDTGRVRVAGLDTTDPAHHPAIRRTVGMVFQRPEDQTVATVVEIDVAFGPENLGLPSEEIRTRVRTALETVGLWEEHARPPHMLSAGQLQRLALAGVLAMRPRCIVFDEATAMLDPVGRQTVRALMRDLNREGITIIAITHLMDEALEAQRVVALHDGRVALDGPPEVVFADAARLDAIGLGVPPAAAIADALRPVLPGLPRGILTSEGLVAALGTYDGACREKDEAAPHRDAAPAGASERSEGMDPRSAPGDGAAGAGEQAPAGAPERLIEATGLGHVYMRDTPFARRALADVALRVTRAGAQGLVGATGSGKSTLLQHLNGLLRPQEGAVQVGAYALDDPDTDLRAVRRMVGLVFQMPETQIFEQYVGDEIAYGPRLMGLEGEALRERVRWAMALVGLDFEGFKDRFTFALSGGEKRKVALASILALQPQALLLDEPTAGLDPASRDGVIANLLEFRERGMTLVLSSHQMEDVAELAERVTVMARGKTVADGPVSEILGQAAPLEGWGLEQPVAARVSAALRAAGWPLPQGLVTEAQLVAGIRRCLGAAE